MSIVDPTCPANAAFMPIGFMVYQSFTYGFLFTLFSKRIGIPVLAWAFAVLVLTNIAWHLEDPAHAQFDFLVYFSVEFLFGILAAVALSAAGRFPRLLDGDLLRTPEEARAHPYDRRENVWDGFALWSALVFVVLGLPMVAGQWSNGCLNVPQETATIVGAVFLVAAIILVVTVFVVAFISTKPRECYRLATRQRLKYFIAATVLAAVHGLSDVLFMEGVTTAYGAIALAVLALLYVALYYYIVYADFGSTRLRRHCADHHKLSEKTLEGLLVDGFRTRSRALVFVVSTALFHIGVLLTAYLTAVLTGNDLPSIAVATLVATIVGVVIVVILRYETRLFDRNYDARSKKR